MSGQLQVSTAMSISETTLTTSSAFSTKQILSRSVHKTERSLLSSPPKKAEVIGTLAKKFNLQLLHNKSGRRDIVYIGMDGGKREYKQKRYMLWKLHDLLEIINGSKIITNDDFSSFTEAFEHELSFR